MIHYKFFQNTDCEFFPCHPTDDPARFSCQFCFCPLYYIKDCGGEYTDFNGMKDCGGCLLPHNDYEYIVGKIVGYNRQITALAGDEQDEAAAENHLSPKRAKAER